MAAVRVPDGTYQILNAGTGTYFDLELGVTKAGNPVIGHTLNGGANQKWVLSNGEGYITLHSLLSEAAAVATTGHIQGGNIVVQENAEHLLLTQDELGQYRIGVIDEPLFFRLPDSGQVTLVRLDPVGLGNDVWEFIGIPE